MIGAVGRLEEAVGETGGVGQQMPQRDRRYLAIGERRTKRRQEACHGIAQRKLAELDHAQRSRGDDRLGQRCKAEDCLLAHRDVAFAIGETGGAAHHDVTVARDQNHGTDEPPLIECTVDRGIDRGRSSCAHGILVLIPVRPHHQ